MFNVWKERKSKKESAEFSELKTLCSKASNRVSNKFGKIFERISKNYMTANFSVKKSLGHHDFAYNIVAKSHPTPHKCVQGFLKYSLGVHRAM